MITIALNGFGRIGRNFIRTIVLDPTALEKIKIAVVNVGPAEISSVAHMFKYDSIMGTFPGNARMNGNQLIINETLVIDIIAECDVEKINWRKYNIEWVVEATGCFTQRDQAECHLKAGARYVLITAPAQQEDIAIIPGVNENKFNPQKDHIVSLGSCTTNAFITTLKVLHDSFGITAGFMTTIHAYTNSQVLLDVEDSDLRRSRAAALNIIPTTTGANKMIDIIFPELAGKVHAMAIRVPVAVVSLIDLTFIAERPISIDHINTSFLKASENAMKGIIGFSDEPLVSSDYARSPFSVTIDSQLTDVEENMGKVFGWYDNEWGYSMRLKDFLLYVSSLTTS